MPSLISHLTGRSLISSRTMVTSNGLSRPLRTIVSLIGAAGLAAHLLDRFVERVAVDQLAIDVGDVVAGLDARLPRRRVLGRSDHLDRPVLHSDRQAEPAVAAVDQGLQRVVVGAFGIRGMRVERGQHAIDRALDQSVVVDRHDIVLLDLLIDAHELLELLVIGRVRGSEGAGGHGDQGERADQRERRQEFADLGSWHSSSLSGARV